MPAVPDSVSPSVGWAVVHLFAQVTKDTDAQVAASAVKAAAGDEHQVITGAVLGHKADVMVMAIGPDLLRLRRLQSDLANAGLEIVDSYVSLTEVSEYAQGMPEEHLKARLYPNLPPDGMPAFCFYPMSKRRDRDQNWYELPYDERKELMYEHGATGRKFRGRVLQLVTGSTGLDDWEWGVTLFAVHPDDLKECVYTMRFDRASARYAEFGPFFTGIVTSLEEALCGLGPGAGHD